MILIIIESLQHLGFMQIKWLIHDIEQEKTNIYINGREQEATNEPVHLWSTNVQQGAAMAWL
jgi:hypothetical protein